MKLLLSSFLTILVAGTFVNITLAQETPGDLGTWQAARNMTAARASFPTSTLLNDGSVLVTGGGGASGAGYTLNSAELYSPSVDLWISIAGMSVAREAHAATLLNNGQVLVTGGTQYSPSLYYVETNTVELYDPTNRTWTTVGSMNAKRSFHTATLLKDGKVLVTGGHTVLFPHVLNSAEVYDPETKTWSPAGTMSVTRQHHTATLLKDGRVIVVGGMNKNHDSEGSTDIYDPVTGAWTAGSNLIERRYGHTATLLCDGRLLVASGANNTTGPSTSSDLYDPFTNTWSPSGVVSPSYFHVAILLSDGRVLIVGGLTGSGSSAGPRIYDPITGSWRNVPGMAQRRLPAASRMQDGRVLVLGGASNTSEIYAPSVGAAPCDPFATLSVDNVRPNTGGNNGTVTIRVSGESFLQGSTLKLVRDGQSEILSTQAVVNGTGDEMVGRVDLSGKPIGKWDVVVTNPEGQSVRIVEGFTIEQGRLPQVWVDIIGRTAFRNRAPYTFYITYGNSGNVDAYGVPLWIGGIPKDTTIKLGFEITNPASPGLEEVIWEEITPEIETDTEKILPLEVTLIPPGYVGTLVITLDTVAHLTDEPIELQAWINSPQFNELQLTIPDDQAPELDPNDCQSATIGFLGKKLFDALGDVTPGSRCIKIIFKKALELQKANLDKQLRLSGGEPTISSQVRNDMSIISDSSKAADCLIDILPLGKLLRFRDFLRIAKEVRGYLKLVANGLDISELGEKCAPYIGPGLDVKRLRVLSVGSFDPNDKVGRNGIGPSRYITSKEPLNYAIFFENKPDATAPAQEVIITDQLDLDAVDVNTFSLGRITFGEKSLTPPPHLSEFTQEVDLRPANNLIVKIAAKLDKTSGLVTLRFSCIDPTTGQVPEDALAGFLPPNRIAPEGEGSLLFTVMPKPGQSSGTVISNKAKIFFDTNEPIVTPEWFNTVDDTKPTSHLLPLASTQRTADFSVNWTGADDESGISSYTVYVSEDGGPYRVWKQQTADTEGVFPGHDGKTYSFFSIARDLVGNLEESKTNAESTTTVRINIIEADGQTLTMLDEADSQQIILTASSTYNTPLSYVITQPAHGHLTGTGTNFVYTPHVGFYGTDRFTFQAKDDNDVYSEPAIVNIIRPDTTPPSVTCASADGDWHSGDVSIICSASDNVSQLANANDRSFSLTTSVGAGTETANAATGSRDVCDSAGNCATAGPISGNKIDRKAPTITITAPSNGVYILNQSATANFTCQDAGSGVATCIGSATNGDNIHTVTVGSKTFMVAATDNVGNEATPQSVPYTVSFGINVLFDQTKAHKSGSTVPIKIQLVDALGQNVSSPILLVQAVSLIQIATTAAETINDAGNSNPDANFRFNSSIGGYIFNLKTTGLHTGTYRLGFTVGADRATHTVQFSVGQ